MLDGYGSKKFWFAIGVCVLAFGYALLAGSAMPSLKEMFSTFTGILEVVTAAYLTGNIANKWVAGKVDPTVAQPAKPVASKQALEADPLDRDLPGAGKR